MRSLPLLKPGSDVQNYRGTVFKSGQDTAVAYVVDLEIKGRRLEQCMDILVRLYAEFLWAKNQTADLILPLPGGYWLKWNDWHDGFRPIFNGINVTMKKSGQSNSSVESYKSYLNIIYSESHTQQFFHAYLPVERKEVQIGDIVIKKGTKGHAVMIVDLARNDKDELFALIGNGDTPACQFFLLNHRKDSPWIPLDFDEEYLNLPLKRKIGWEGLRRFNLPRIK
jgi:hypothetical protein